MKPTLVIGEWEVDPISGQIRRSDEIRHLRPKAMAVLECLADAKGELLERDVIIARVWNRALVTDEPLTTCIAELRRVLGDEASEPRYIQTVPKRGYRLVATLAAIDESADQVSETVAAAGNTQQKLRFAWLVLPVAALALLAYWAGSSMTGMDPSPPGDSVTDNSPAEPPTIAVLPFLNISSDPENDYIGEGIAEEILNSLTKISDLRVRSRNSSFALQGRNIDISTIAERLKVSYILEGSVRRSSDMLRITAQLIDVEADAHIWSEVFEKDPQNIFEVQGEIATRISDVLEIALDLDQQKQLSDVGTTNKEAYEHYLWGRQLLARRTTISITTAVDVFSRALELDPNYAQAYLGIADANLLLPQYNDLPDADYYESGLEAVNIALQLDPELGEAYPTLGSIREELHDFAGAEEAFEIALTRAPRFATTYHWYGFLLYAMARQEDAHEMLLLAIEQDPLSNLLSYGLSANLVAMGRFDEAEARYRKIIESDPEFSWAYEGMGELNWNGRGQLDAAAEWYEIAIRYDPDSSYFPALLGAIYLDSDKPDEAAEWIGMAMQIQPRSPMARSHDALLHAYNGDYSSAYRIALSILDDDPKHYLALHIARNYDLRNGNLEAAKARYAAGFPELLSSGVQLNVGNFQAAVDLALVLQRMEDGAQADILLDRAWAIASNYPRHGLPYRLSDVKILSLEGRHDDAFGLLVSSIRSGWRPYWWLFLEHDPALEPVRADARFQSLMEEI